MKHLTFIDSSVNMELAFQGSYNPLLVLVSYAVAVVAAHAALKLSLVIASSGQTPVRYAWIGAGSVAMGIGIWAMHFIGMQAYRLPMPVVYQPGLTLLSMLPAMLASAVALDVISRTSLDKKRLVIGGVLMGGGIAVMHYTGMAAMRMDALMMYDPILFGVSLVVGVLLAMLALYIKFLPKKKDRLYVAVVRLGGPMIMGLAVVGMHYTAMFAVYYFPDGGNVSVTSVDPIWMTGVIGVAAFLVLSMVLLAAFAARQITAKSLLSQEVSRRGASEAALEIATKTLEQRVMEQTVDIQRSEAQLKAVLETLTDGLIIIDSRGTIADFNPSAETIFGYGKSEVTGMNVKMLMPEPYHTEHDNYLHHYLKTGEKKVIGIGREVVGLRKDGSTFPMDLAVSEARLGTDCLFTGIVRDISARKESEEALHRLNLELQAKSEALEEATRLKTEFLANMSHELRTPMNAIIGFTNRVIKKAGDLLPERQLNNLHTVERNARHLLVLINGLLDISKIEAGKMEVFAEEFTLSSLVAEVLDLTQSLVSDRGLEVVTDLSAEEIVLHSDKIKLKQVLINLLSNAVKFTEQGCVTVAARMTAGASAKQDPFFKPDMQYVVLSVADTGIGMNDEEVSYIFDAFRQADGSVTRNAGGTGLGLAITKRFVELLEGRVEVESVKGKGTTFTVTLPVRIGGAPQPPAREVVTAPEERGLLEVGSTVLCIDDDPEVLELFRGYLSDEGYQVISAQSADEGIKKAKEWQPFAITLDIMMPHKDGWSMLNELKSDEATKDIPVIIVSITGSRALGYKLGACDYLQKPIEPEALTGAIDRILHGRVKSVLAVDDNPDVLSLIQQVLADRKITVRTARSGVEALEAVKQDIPDLILLDLLMPEMDGFEVIRRLKDSEEWAAIPVIVITAKTLESDERLFLNQKVESVVAKDGMTTDALLKEMADIMKRIRERAT